MDYDIYFSNRIELKRLWHPLNFPTQTKENAKKLAEALKSTNLDYAWAYGPSTTNGITEV